MTQFHDTPQGHRFLNETAPRIAHSLERIADGLEKMLAHFEAMAPFVLTMQEGLQQQIDMQKSMNAAKKPGWMGPDETPAVPPKRKLRKRTKPKKTDTEEEMNEKEMEELLSKS